jgi:DNA helicase II / ATP-dependent DNA helicase PcrA
MLAMTFTNKARDNRGSRLTDHVGPQFRRHVTVVNFHGLGLHLYNHHKYVLEDPVRELLPDDRALRAIEKAAFEEYRVPRNVQHEVRLAIRDAKSGSTF